MSRCGALLCVVLVGCSNQTEPDRANVKSTSSLQAVDANQTPPVKHNRGSEVEDGFRGKLHPALRAQESLKLTATCSPISTGRGFDEGYFPQQFRGPFDEFVVAKKEQTYSSEDFSAFLPEKFGKPGQAWEIEVARVEQFLKQFHTGASMKLQAPGRRGGPNGGFGVLRAISDERIEIVARVHAEILLSPGSYVTPAYFECRLLIDRSESRVTAFSLALPNDIGLNVTLTAILPTEALIDIVYLDHMQSVGGEVAELEPDDAQTGISIEDARQRLKAMFYRFQEIAWVKPEQAVEEARKQNRPILAIVLWGDLDDQSC